MIELSKKLDLVSSKNQIQRSQRKRMLVRQLPILLAAMTLEKNEISSERGYRPSSSLMTIRSNYLSLVFSFNFDLLKNI